MIRDLTASPSVETRTADVCIVGGGIAGLILADRLQKHRRRVLVLESGGGSDPGGVDPRNDVEIGGQPYAGATLGRARNLGGTSTRWGGALIPFFAEDFASRPQIGAEAWPIRLAELNDYVEQVEKLFGVDQSPYDSGFLGQRSAAEQLPRDDDDIAPRFAKWPTFRRRNLATLLDQTLRGSPNLEVWLNATATGFEIDDDTGRLSSVHASTIDGQVIKVTAPHFVVAAGAIESTRLLLLLDRASRGRAFANCGALGAGLHDHVSLAAATLAPHDPDALNRMAGFRFVGNTMRSARFELRPAAQARLGIGGAFAHIACETEGGTGFDALRDLLRGLQTHGKLEIAKAAAAARHLPYLIRAGAWRFGEGRVLWPSQARYRLHLVIEQAPVAANRIALGESLDAFGQPRARITWRVSDLDQRAALAFARTFDQFWRRQALSARIPLGWDVDISRDELSDNALSGDIYHPGGTTRMSDDRGRGVVDRNLRCFSVSNLHVVATSVFPTGASANPTLMLMALSLRLGDHLGLQAAASA